MNHLIEWYKNTKDWNIEQTGGHQRQSVFCEEIDAVVGCRDVVTMQHAAEARNNHSDLYRKLVRIHRIIRRSRSPETRTDRKKKRKRGKAKELDEERHLI